MGKEYRDLTGEEPKSKTSSAMRTYCQRPGRVDENGNPVYFTEQSHRDKTNINNIIKKYHRTGLIDHVSKIEATYGDVTGIEFQAAQEKVIAAKNAFDELPSHIRKRFDNEPHKLLSFMDDANNRDEAISLGLIRADWTEDTDGLGEHIKTGENKKKSRPKNIQKTTETPD